MLTSGVGGASLQVGALCRETGTSLWCCSEALLQEGQSQPPAFLQNVVRSCGAVQIQNQRQSNSANCRCQSECSKVADMSCASKDVHNWTTGSPCFTMGWWHNTYMKCAYSDACRPYPCVAFTEWLLQKLSCRPILVNLLRPHKSTMSAVKQLGCTLAKESYSKSASESHMCCACRGCHIS
jgi:hypothetical protein